MTGSVLDGEDLVQETLAQAHFRLGTMRRGLSFEAWVFRIAHNRCVDWLRRRQRHRRYLAQAAGAESAASPIAVNTVQVPGALAVMVGALPPMERATVLLKDVFDYSLAEAATVVGTSVGAVKAALHRGRGKLRGEPTVQVSQIDPGARALLDAYVAAFNARDWDRVNELIRADARLEVVGMLEAFGREEIKTTYYRGYIAAQVPWHLSVATIDGELALLVWRVDTSGWRARSAVRIDCNDSGIRAIRDYAHCSDVLDGAAITVLGSIPASP